MAKVLSATTLVVGALILLTMSAATVGGEEGFYAELTVGEPLVYGKLAVYPVYLPGGGEELGDILTMEEALETGKFQLAELEEGASVNTLEVRNDTGKHVVLLAGEMVRGAKQDRIISYDTVVPPGGKYAVAAFCVEAGRWTDVSERFEYRKEFAPASIRGTAQGKNDQGEVWAEVSKVNAERGTVTESDALTASYSDAEFQKQVKEYEKAFGELAQKKEVVGVVVFTDGAIAAGDIFANHDLFRTIWPRLLSGYAMDAALAAEVGEVPDAAAVKAYLAQLEEAEREQVFEDDVQERSNLNKGDMNAYELEYRGKKMHVNVY